MAAMPNSQATITANTAKSSLPPMTVQHPEIGISPDGSELNVKGIKCNSLAQITTTTTAIIIDIVYATHRDR